MIFFNKKNFENELRGNYYEKRIGSFSKNSDTANSDIDILVKMEFKKGMYQNFCSLHKKLEEIFQKRVDLVDESMFEYKFKNPKVQKYKDDIKEEILRSVIYV